MSDQTGAPEGNPPARRHHNRAVLRVTRGIRETFQPFGRVARDNLRRQGTLRQVDIKSAGGVAGRKTPRERHRLLAQTCSARTHLARLQFGDKRTRPNNTLTTQADPQGTFTICLRACKADVRQTAILTVQCGALMRGLSRGPPSPFGRRSKIMFGFYRLAPGLKFVQIRF